MCLQIDNNIHPTNEPIVLKKKLIVFKTVKKHKDKIYSPYYDYFAWEIRKLYTVQRFEKHMVYHMSEQQYTISAMVEKGFHSADFNAVLELNKKVKFFHCNIYIHLPCNVYPEDNNTVAVIEIPEGAEVYYGTDGDIVSNKVKMLCVLDNPIEQFALNNKIFVGRLIEKYYGQDTPFNHRQLHLNIYKRMIIKSLEALKKEGIEDSETIRQLKQYKTTTNWLLFKNNVFKLLNIKTIC